MPCSPGLGVGLVSDMPTTPRSAATEGIPRRGSFTVAENLVAAKVEPLDRNDRLIELLVREHARTS